MGRIAPVDSRAGSTRAMIRIATIPNPPKPAFAMTIPTAAAQASSQSTGVRSYICSLSRAEIGSVLKQRFQENLCFHETIGNTPASMKIVVAYSGGLDTSVILNWLKETYSAEVIAFCANIGQEEELVGLEEKALQTGASKCFIDDLCEEFARDFIFPMMQAAALY